MLKDSIWQIQHDDGHPNDMQGSCPICIFKKSKLPPAHEVTKKIFDLIDTITDDYIKEVRTK